MRLSLLVPLLQLAAGFVIGCEPADRSGQARSEGGPLAGRNVLLITLDTTRADRLGCYGYENASTPVLDELARNGILFTDAIAQVPLTLPSHGSLLTGRYPREFGVRTNGRDALGPDHPTLASIFKERGYRTGAFVASFVLDGRFGLDRGFEVYEDDMEAESAHGSPLHWELRGDVVTDRALAWLKTVSDQRFFAWVHYFDPHDPYEPPGAFADHADPYDGEIAFMDVQIGRLVGWLDEGGLRERTLIVVVGDHGEAFGEHGEDGHGMFLYDTTLHVPLIFSLPGAMAPSGRRIDGVVEIAGIVPTLLDLFGWEKPEGLLSASLMPALSDPGSTEPPQATAFAESNYAADAFNWAEQRSLSTNRWKYVHSTRPELFDRTADPGELHNVIDAHPETAAELLAVLSKRYEQMTPGQAAAVAVSEDGRNAVESLGYVQRDGAASDELLTPGLPDPKDKLDVLQTFKKAHALMSGDDPDRFRRAMPLLERVVSEAPESLMFRHTLGTTYMKVGRFDKAVAALEEALALAADHGPTHAAMGECLANLGRLDEALVHLEQAVAVAEVRPDTYATLGDVLSALGRRDDAIEPYRKALELVPDYADVHRRVGMLYARRGDLTGAIRHFERALPEFKTDAQLRYNLGNAYFASDRHAEAVTHFEAAVAHRPDYGQAWIGLGLARYQQGDVAGGMEALEKAMALPDAAAEANYQFGMLLASRGDLDRAEGMFERAMILDPSYAAGLEELARQYTSLGRSSEAVRVLRLAAAHGQGNVRVLTSLAELLATAPEKGVRDGASALSFARQAVEASPSPHPHVLGVLAAAHAEAGDFERAVATAEEAVDLAKRLGQQPLVESLERQLEGYRQERPLRRPRS